MSEAVLRYVRGTGGRRDDLPKKDDLDPRQKAALRQLQQEAKAKGSFLSSGGKGGLDSRLVLRVMQRDHYRCKSCGRKGDKYTNGGIGVHHIGGIVESEKLSRLGHQNLESNLVSICSTCHDREHTKAKKEGVDSSQVTPLGDVGTKRDHGLPVASKENLK